MSEDDDIVHVHCRYAHFLSNSLLFAPVLRQCRRQDQLVSAESIGGRRLKLNKLSALDNNYYESLDFSSHCVDLELNEEVLMPERFVEVSHHACVNPDDMTISKWCQKTTLKGDVSHFSSVSRTSDTCVETNLTSEQELLKMTKGSRCRYVIFILHCLDEFLTLGFETIKH